MRARVLALSLLMLPGYAAAQEEGLSLNMGRGLNSGGSVGWTFKENWTLQPTIAAGYSAQTGWQMSLGSTVLKSFGYGHRVYGYVGAGLYYGSANRGYVQTVGGLARIGASGSANGAYNSTLAQNPANVLYATAPIGLRVQVRGNVELFAESAYQKALSSQFFGEQTGQFYGNARERIGATFGLTYRLN